MPVTGMARQSCGGADTKFNGSKSSDQLVGIASKRVTDITKKENANCQQHHDTEM